MKFTLWIRELLGDKSSVVLAGASDIKVEDKESLMKDIWKDLFSIKSSQ